MNIYILWKFTSDDPTDYRQCAKGKWLVYSMVTTRELAERWVAIDKLNRKYDIHDMELADKEIKTEMGEK